jgi:hypothetical protein
VILFFCTPTEADILARSCIDPTLRAKLQRLIERNLLPTDELPRTVLFEDQGDGLQMGITYLST